jgi:hypothetical protein
MFQARKKLNYGVFCVSGLKNYLRLLSPGEFQSLCAEIENNVVNYFKSQPLVNPQTIYELLIDKSKLFKSANIFPGTNMYTVVVNDLSVMQLMSSLSLYERRSIPFHLWKQFSSIFFKHHPWDYPDVSDVDLEKIAKNLLDFFVANKEIFKKEVYENLTYNLGSSEYKKNKIIKSYKDILEQRIKLYSVSEITSGITNNATLIKNKSRRVYGVVTELTTEDVCRKQVDSINPFFTTKTVENKDLVDYVKESIAGYITKSRLKKQGFYEFVIKTNEVVGKVPVQFLEDLDLTKLCEYTFVPQNDFVYDDSKKLTVLVKDDIPADTNLISVLGKFNLYGVFEIKRIQAGTFIIHPQFSKNQKKEYRAFCMHPLPGAVNKRKHPDAKNVRGPTNEEKAKYYYQYPCGVTQVTDNLENLLAILIKRPNAFIKAIKQRSACPDIDVTAGFGYSS